MPKCVVCNVILPPEFLDPTEDKKAKKCIFCTRGIDSISYFSKSRREQMITTKAEIIKEYDIFLEEISKIPNVEDIIDAIKNREVNDHIMHTKSAVKSIKKNK